MATLPKEGVALVAEGAAQFFAAMEKAQRLQQKTSEGFASMAKQTQVASRASEGASGVLSAMAVTVGTLAATVIEKGVAALGELAQSFKAVILGAAQFEGVQKAFGSLVQSMGQGADEMANKLSEAMMGTVRQTDLMLNFNRAASLVSRDFAEKLPEAMGLLSKVSISTGTDMNFLMNSLTIGVGRMSKMILDNLGIQVELTEATKKAAEMYSVQAAALTKSQQQMGLMEVVLEKLRDSTSSMGDSVMTTSIRLQRLKASGQDAGDYFGQFFQPALGTAADALYRFNVSLKEAIQEGGALYPILVDMGAALGLVADAFAAVIDWVVEWIEGAGPQLNRSMADIAFGMAEWGVQMVVSLAEGIVEAANTVLVQAMQFLGSILSIWLEPGSPPKIAPGLSEWGAQSVREWLTGWTKGNFDILKSIASPMQKVLTKIDFADMLPRMTEALALGGDVDPTIFEDLAKMGGTLGSDVAKLAKLQFQLAGATDELARAEKGLADSRKNLVSSGEAVSALTEEHNALLREGASKEVLARKLEEINAAEEQEQLAVDQVVEAEAQVDVEKDQNAELLEQIKHQQNILDLLFMMDDAYKAAAESAEKVTGKKGKPSIPTVEMPKLKSAPFISGITAAIDAAKARLKERMADLFGPLANYKPDFTPTTDAWGQMWAGLGLSWEGLGLPTFEGVQKFLKKNFPITMIGLGFVWKNLMEKDLPGAIEVFKETWRIFTEEELPEAWGKFVEILQKWWEEDALPFLQPALDWLDLNLIPAIAGVGAALLTLSAPAILAGLSSLGVTLAIVALSAWSAASAFVAAAIAAAPFILLAAGIGALVFLLVKHGPQLWTTIQQLGFIIGHFATVAWKAVVDFTTKTWKSIVEWVSKTWGAFTGWVSRVWAAIVGWTTKTWKAIGDWVSDTYQVIVDWASDTWAAIVGWVQDVWTSLVDWFAKMQGRWKTFWSLLRILVVAAWQRIVGAVKDWIEKVRMGIVSKFRAIQQWWNQFWRDLFDRMGIDLGDMKERWRVIWGDIVLIVSTVWTRIKDWVAEKVGEVVTWITTKFEKLSAWWAKTWDAISTKVTEIWDDIVAWVIKQATAIWTGITKWIGDVVAWWAKTWDAISTKVTEIWDDIVAWVIKQATAIWTAITTEVDKIGTYWTEQWDAISTKATEIWDAIVLAVTTQVGKVWTAITTKVAEVETEWGTKWDAISTKLTEIWDAIALAVSTKIEEVYTSITDKIDSIVTWAGEQIETWKTMGEDLIQGLIDGIAGMAGKLISAVTGGVEDAIAAAKRLLKIPSSPSGVFMEIGKDMALGQIMGYAKGMRGLQSQFALAAAVPQQAVPAYMSPSVAAGPASAPATAASRPPVVVQFGDVTIRNGMDLEAFDVRVEQAVVRGLRRGME